MLNSLDVSSYRILSCPGWDDGGRIHNRKMNIDSFEIPELVSQALIWSERWFCWGERCEWGKRGTVMHHMNDWPNRDNYFYDNIVRGHQWDKMPIIGAVFRENDDTWWISLNCREERTNHFEKHLSHMIWVGMNHSFEFFFTNILTSQIWREGSSSPRFRLIWSTIDLKMWDHISLQWPHSEEVFSLAWFFILFNMNSRLESDYLWTAGCNHIDWCFY